MVAPARYQRGAAWVNGRCWLGAAADCRCSSAHEALPGGADAAAGIGTALMIGLSLGHGAFRHAGANRVAGGGARQAFGAKSRCQRRSRRCCQRGSRRPCRPEFRRPCRRGRRRPCRHESERPGCWSRRCRSTPCPPLKTTRRMMYPTAGLTIEYLSRRTGSRLKQVLNPIARRVSPAPRRMAARDLVRSDTTVAVTSSMMPWTGAIG